MGEEGGRQGERERRRKGRPPSIPKNINMTQRPCQYCEPGTLSETRGMSTLGEYVWEKGYTAKEFNQQLKGLSKK